MKHLGLLKQFLLLFALIVGSSSVWADNVIIVPSDGTAVTNSDYTITKSPITVAVTASTLTSDEIRVFKSQTITISSTTATISKIVFTCSANGTTKYGPGCLTTDTGYSYESDGPKGTWEGSSKSIVLTASSNQCRIKEIVVTYSSGGGTQTVDVTGVSLDPSVLNMTVGDTETLTATVLPSDATNKNVSWESDDEEVATVSSSGVVTAEGVGTATITVTTEDGNKTATCDVTVTTAGGGGEDFPSVTFDFTDADAWGWPTDYVLTEKSYTNDGYTFTLGASSNGHKIVMSNDVPKALIFGRKDATLIFPAFPFNVSKFIIYGNSTASANTTFNIYVGQTKLFTSDFTNCKLTHEIVIPTNYQTAGTVYTYKVTNANNAQVSKIEVFGYENVAVTTAGLATYASDNNLDFTNVEGLVANSAKINGNTVTFESVATVPAGEGILLKATEELTETATFAVPVVSTVTAWDAADNDFIRGNNEAVQSTEGNTHNYILSTNASGVVGFYLAAGKTIPKNRAYLSTTSTGAPALDMNWGEGTTGIVNVNRETMINNQYYTLDGRRVAQPTKGLYIFNGKKVVIK